MTKNAISSGTFFREALDPELTPRLVRSGTHPARTGRRRCLLREGRALCTYAIGEPPPAAVLRRYMRVVERLRGGHSLGLPPIFLVFPCLLSLEPAAWCNAAAATEFSWRLDAATLLSEATPYGACHLFGPDRGHGRLKSILLVCGAVANEALWQAVRFALQSAIRLALGRTRSAT